MGGRLIGYSCIIGAIEICSDLCEIKSLAKCPSGARDGRSLESPPTTSKIEEEESSILTAFGGGS